MKKKKQQHSRSQKNEEKKRAKCMVVGGYCHSYSCTSPVLKHTYTHTLTLTLCCQGRRRQASAQGDDVLRYCATF